jgi:hypothetical protein
MALAPRILNTAVAIVLTIALTAAAGLVESIIGEVLSVDAPGRSLTVQPDDGEETVVSLGDDVVLLRTVPGATSLDGAVAVTLGEISPEDRVLAQGTPSANGAALVARRLVVMTRDTLESRHQAERREWRRRGISGVITALDPAREELVVRVARSVDDQGVVVPTAGRGVVFRRYAAGSVRFADARPSDFSELQVGDQVRVLGERSEDGARVEPEQVVSGAFRIVQGTVERANEAQGVLVVKTAGENRSDVSIHVGPDTLARRLPPMLVARLQGGGERGEAGRGPPGGGLRRFDPERMLERLPPLDLGEVTPGEIVVALGARGGEPASLTAIKLVVCNAAEATGSRARGGRGGGQADSDLLGDLQQLGVDKPW